MEPRHLVYILYFEILVGIAAIHHVSLSNIWTEDWEIGNKRSLEEAWKKVKRKNIIKTIISIILVIAVSILMPIVASSV